MPIDTPRTTLHCTHCSTPVSVLDCALHQMAVKGRGLYCSNCGSAIIHPDPALAPNASPAHWADCPACGSMVQPSFIKPWWGSQDQKKLWDEQVQKLADDVNKRTFQPLDPKGPPDKLCPKCSKLMAWVKAPSGTALFCSSCGHYILHPNIPASDVEAWCKQPTNPTFSPPTPKGQPKNDPSTKTSNPPKPQQMSKTRPETTDTPPSQPYVPDPDQVRTIEFPLQIITDQLLPFAEQLLAQAQTNYAQAIAAHDQSNFHLDQTRQRVHDAQYLISCIHRQIRNNPKPQ